MFYLWRLGSQKVLNKLNYLLVTSLIKTIKFVLKFYNTDAKDEIKNLSYVSMIQHKVCSGQVKKKKKNQNILCFSLTSCSSYCCCFFVLWSSQTYLKFVEQLLQRHLLFRNTLQERLSAEHWKSLVGDILVQLIGQNDVSRCFFLFFLCSFYAFGPRHWTLRELTIALIWVVQTAFSDMYLGYTTTLASFLSLEFNRLNHPENSHKVQVFCSINIIQQGCINQTRWWIFFFPVCHLAERPGGERGNETALPAAGTCVSHPQLPEPHPGESAATEGPVRTARSDSAGQS